MSKWTFLALDAGGASPRLAGCAQSNIVKKRAGGLALRCGAAAAALYTGDEELVVEGTRKEIKNRLIWLQGS